MGKTLKTILLEAEAQMLLWQSIADDNQALTDRVKTREEALCLANYFEGKVDGLVESMTTP